MSKPHITTTIHAPAARIWSILTNAQALVACNSGITRIDGTIAQGQKFNLWSDVDPGRAFPVRVAIWQPHNRMEWHGGMPLGLFTGKRIFTLTEAQRHTTFTMTEIYTGPLRPLLTKLIPNLQPSFETFANALKTTAETAQ